MDTSTIRDSIRKEFLDCTIRDGGYINRWHFSDECVRDLITTLDGCGYDYIEVGFRNKPEIYNNKPCGKWRYCREEDLINVVTASRKIKIAVMADFASSDIGLFPDKSDTIIDMVRVAFHSKDLKEAMMMCNELKLKGYIVCANAMATMNYDDEQLKELVTSALEYKIDYVYIADSYGCLIPDQINDIYDKMSACVPLSKRMDLKFGFHAHNNIQNAYANMCSCSSHRSLEGINIYDSCVFGMGRGSGNLCTEIVINTFFDTNNLREILLYAEKYIISLYSDKPTGWGYNIPLVISAHFKAHPNYVLKLNDYNITSISDIWKYIEIVYRDDKHKIFDIEYFNNLVASSLMRVNNIV